MCTYLILLCRNKGFKFNRRLALNEARAFRRLVKKKEAG